MTQDAFRTRERAIEDSYFRKKDRELIDKMRQAARAEAARGEMGRRVGFDDPALLAELEALGFTPETVVLLPVMPALEVAWAEDALTDAERQLVVRLARSLGVREDDPADRQLAAWMAARPAPDVFARAARLVAAMLDAGAHEVGAGLTAAGLVAHCERIAEASNGILGTRLMSVSAEERALLDRLAADLTGRR